MEKNYRLNQFFIRIVMLMSLSFVVVAGWADEKKIGMLLPQLPVVTAGVVEKGSLSDDEQVAAQWFYDEYMSPNRYEIEANRRGAFVSTSEMDLFSNYSVIWVMVDETGLAQDAIAGKVNIPALTAFYKAGGSILFTNQAVQLLVSTGRLEAKYGPNSFEYNYTETADAWGLNAKILNESNYMGYPIYNGMEKTGGKYMLNNAFRMKNHICMWNFNAAMDADLVADRAVGRTTLYKYQQLNNCFVVGTNEWDDEGVNGAIIEFNPTGEYKGWGIAIGLGAYEWAAENNGLAENIKRLTKNALRHLKRRTPKEEIKVGYFIMTDRSSYNGNTLDIDPEILHTESYYGEHAGDEHPYHIDLDEKEAYQWFHENYIIKERNDNIKGYALTMDYIANNDIDDFDMIWVHIDREIIEKDHPEFDENRYSNVYRDGDRGDDMYSVLGLGNPDPVVQNAYNALKYYYMNGGNLLLSSEAGLLLSESAFGRLHGNPKAVYHEPDNMENVRVWGINAHNGYADHRGHPIYKDMETLAVGRKTLDGPYNPSADDDPYEIYPLLLGRGGNMAYDAESTGINAFSDNHNVVFLGDYYGDGKSSVLEDEENCTVLGWWGHDLNGYGPGLVEFHPTRLYAGTALTIGFGAYDWYALTDDDKQERFNEQPEQFQKSGNTDRKIKGYRSNIEKLTENAIKYLAECSYDKMEVTFNIKRFKGYTTLYYSDRDFVLPDRVTAYTYTEVYDKREGENYNRTECEMIESGQVVPAGTAVVMHSDIYDNDQEKASDVITRKFSTISNYGAPNYTYKRNSDTDPNVITTINSGYNILRGYDIPTLVDKNNPDAGDSRFWIVTTGHSGIGFYWATSTGFVDENHSFTCPAHKSYLVASKNVEAKSIRLPIFDDDNDETAIDLIIKENTDVDKEYCYTIQGIKVVDNYLRPGIYIKNGKKFVVK